MWMFAEYPIGRIRDVPTSTADLFRVVIVYYFLPPGIEVRKLKKKIIIKSTGPCGYFPFVALDLATFSREADV